MVFFTRIAAWFSSAGRWFRGSSAAAPASSLPGRVSRKLQSSISIQGEPRRPSALSLQTLKASLKTGKITPSEYAARVARLTSGRPR